MGFGKGGSEVLGETLLWYFSFTLNLAWHLLLNFTSLGKDFVNVFFLFTSSNSIPFVGLTAWYLPYTAFRNILSLYLICFWFFRKHILGSYLLIAINNLKKLIHNFKKGMRFLNKKPPLLMARNIDKAEKRLGLYSGFILKEPKLLYFRVYLYI